MGIELNIQIPPSRLVYGAGGRHSFGGPSIHRGAHPHGSKLPVHRILTLDVRDPLFPLSNFPHATLPLYYPLAFDTGGGEIQYSVASETAIQIIHLSSPVSDDEPYVTVDQFPEKRGKLVAFTYEEARACAMVDCRLAYDLNKSDSALISKIDAFSSIRVGPHLLSCQGEVMTVCRNDDCAWRGLQVKIPLFALVPCSPMHAGALWGEFSDDVELCFGMCRPCGSIIAVNRCT